MGNPFDRAKEPVNHDIYERFFGSLDIVKLRKEFTQDLTEEIRTEVDKHIKINNPGILVNYNMLYQELTTMVKDFKVTIKSIESKAKKVFDSSSLAEDVFNMRDEMKNTRKKLDKLNSGLKKLSKLGEIDLSN